jgi:toxin-antitoxin system PIN domain toxin
LIRLLDVNVLVALIDQDHPFHAAAHGWLAANQDEGWATCPITENGVIRILSGLHYAGISRHLSEVINSVLSLRQAAGHVFWPDDISILDAAVIQAAEFGSSRQITDTYLLALAVHHGGQLATFDRRLRTDAVIGGNAALVLLPQ